VKNKNSEDNRNVILMVLVVKKQSPLVLLTLISANGVIGLVVLDDLCKLYDLSQQKASSRNGNKSQSRFGELAESTKFCRE
jgi:hypothetical protein